MLCVQASLYLVSVGTMDARGARIVTTAPPFPTDVLLSTGAERRYSVFLQFSFNGGSSFNSFAVPGLSPSFEYFAAPYITRMHPMEGERPR